MHCCSIAETATTTEPQRSEGDTGTGAAGAGVALPAAGAGHGRGVAWTGPPPHVPVAAGTAADAAGAWLPPGAASAAATAGLWPCCCCCCCCAMRNAFERCTLTGPCGTIVMVRVVGLGGALSAAAAWRTRLLTALTCGAGGSGHGARASVPVALDPLCGTLGWQKQQVRTTHPAANGKRDDDHDGWACLVLLRLSWTSICVGELWLWPSPWPFFLKPLRRREGVSSRAPASVALSGLLYSVITRSTTD